MAWLQRRRLEWTLKNLWPRGMQTKALDGRRMPVCACSVTRPHAEARRALPARVSALSLLRFIVRA